MQQVSIQEVVVVTERLAAVLEQETAYLKSMQVREIEPLQRDKHRLTSALEMMKRRIEGQPQGAAHYSEDEKAEYREAMMRFKGVMEENFRHLMVAKTINEQVVEAVKDGLREQLMPAQYNGKGNGGHSGTEALSMAINDVV